MNLNETLEIAPHAYDICSHNSSCTEDYSRNTTGLTCDLWEGNFLKNLISIMNTTWSLIAVLGIISNVMILVVLLSGKKINVTQYFIINLALSDIIFLIICPTFLMINYNNLQVVIFKRIPDILGSFYCKLDYFSTNVCVFIACLTLLAMTFDRYLVVMHPFKALEIRTKRRVITVNVCIWIVSIILSLPQGYYRGLETFQEKPKPIKICSSSQELTKTKINLIYTEINLEQFFVLYTILISYVLPLATIIVCYMIMIIKIYTEKNNFPIAQLNQNNKRKKNRRKILFMIFLVSTSFCICWFPLHSIIFSLKFVTDFPHCSKYLYTLKAISHTMIFMNSMLNPFFYTIIGNNFKKKVTEQKMRMKMYYSRDDLGESIRSRLNTNSMRHTNNLVKKELRPLRGFEQSDF